MRRPKNYYVATFHSKPVVHDEKQQPLVCYGCAHSISSYDMGFPSGPSGERPCQFCVRNPARINEDDEGKWYDQKGTIKGVMDCYHTCDMKAQINKWLDDVRKDGQRRIKIPGKGITHGKSVSQQGEETGQTT